MSRNSVFSNIAPLSRVLLRQCLAMARAGHRFSTTSGHIDQWLVDGYRAIYALSLLMPIPSLGVRG